MPVDEGKSGVWVAWGTAEGISPEMATLGVALPTAVPHTEPVSVPPSVRHGQATVFPWALRSGQASASIRERISISLTSIT